MIRICKLCRHHNAPASVQLFDLGSSRSAGEIKAQREWMEESEKRRSEEQRRVEDGYQFDYEPEFFAWCGEHTPTPEQLQALTDSLHEGDFEAVQGAAQRGMKFSIDAVNGTLSAVYELCLKKNPAGQCPGFAPRPRK